MDFSGGESRLHSWFSRTIHPLIVAIMTSETSRKERQCKLCLQNKKLVESHMMPRALYEAARRPGNDTILISPEVVMPATRHVKDYLLCLDCENRLNRDGESWVLPRLATTHTRFPMYQALVSEGPIMADSEFTVYSGAHNPLIEVDSIVNFALGLFWKASVHSWKGGSSKEPLIDLGPYSERFRRFLFDKTKFPEHVALWVCAASPESAIMGFHPPYETERSPTWRNFLCLVPGVHLMLAVGKGIPYDLSKFSISHNLQAPILVWDRISGNLRNQLKSTFLRANKTQSFLKLWTQRQAAKKGPAST